MSSVTNPKGPLPRRVYWTRRLLVLGLGLALVFGISRLFVAAPERPDNPSARPAAGVPSGPSAGVTPSVGSTKAAKPGSDDRRKPRKTLPTKTPLAVPTGPCVDDDVRVAPSVDGKPYAGGNVAITLNLTTLSSPACNWEVSSSSVVLKLTSGTDRIWSTQDCPTAIARRPVVVRKDHVTKVPVVWSGQRSDDECSKTAGWAEPGYYHAAAAALGAEPTEHQFELLAPLRPTITKTAKPKIEKKKRD